MRDLAEQYINAGFVITPIPEGTKGPHTKGWQRLENCITQVGQINGHAGGWGLCHAYSGTMALDIDQGDKAIAWLNERDVDLVGLFKSSDAVRINSGRPGHGKLIYRLPNGFAPLRSKKVKDKTKHDFIDFRCSTRGGLTVQDCLPGTIHPDTGLPYTWQGDWHSIPDIPQALIPIWEDIIRRKNKLEAPPRTEVPDGTVAYGSGLQNKVRSMLEHIDPEGGYELWLQVLMALHSLNEPWALNTAHKWSEGKAHGKSVDMYSPAELEAKWNSFSLEVTDGVGIGTLRKIAKDDGWIEYTSTAIGMFGEIARADEGVPSAVPLKIEPVVFLYDIKKFLDTDLGVMNTAEHMNMMNPMGKGATWSSDFFRDKVDKGNNWFKSITYRPGVATGPYEYDEFNIWKPPLNIDPAAGDISIWLELMEHLFPEELVRDHILQWMAFTLQRQDVKINHAVLIIGDEQGSGKDTAFEPLLHGIGSENHTMVFPAELHGSFNDFLKGKKLLVVQEIMDYSKGELEHYLKPLLACPPYDIAISEKFVGRYKLPNIWNTLMFSNELNAVKVSKSDRRYFIASTKAKRWARIKELWRWYDRGGTCSGLNKVLWYLLNLDVSDFDAYEPPPFTDAKREVIDLSRSGMEIEIEEYLAFNVSLVEFSIRELQNRMQNPKMSAHITGSALRKLGYGKHKEGKINKWSKLK